jgi:hypothetical protein
MNKINKFGLLLILFAASWKSGICQNVVQNPTVTQTITQPAGTELDINGIQLLTWPGLFRMANEGNGNMVLRDMSQANAWFMSFRNSGNSTGDIEFFGNFTNHGALIPNGVGVGSVGTFANPWGSMVANGMSAGSISAGSISASFISKGAGSFKIDHPLDPLHKYLQHSFVESPDMKNVYDGIAVLDKRGESWVILPDWFQALNSDFRYQLTSIGVPGRGLYIAQEVTGNKFKIAGGMPGARVSWQVTGIRQDEFAKSHRIKVEEAKPAAEQGKRLYQNLASGEQKDASVQHDSQAVPTAAVQTVAQHGNQN